MFCLKIIYAPTCKKVITDDNLSKIRKENVRGEKQKCWSYISGKIKFDKITQKSSFTPGRQTCLTACTEQIKACKTSTNLCLGNDNFVGGLRIF